MITLLIFDLDGTLVDTAQDITDAFNHAASPLGIKPLSVERVTSMVSGGISNLIDRMFALRSDSSWGSAPEQKTLAMRSFLSYYSDHLLDNSRPYPGVSETLSVMSCYRMAVISNKREGLSRKVLEGTGLARHFACILGSDSASEKKPSPVPVFEVLKRLNAVKEEAVIVGDSDFDIETGKNAGIRTIAVTYGFRERSALLEADYLIDSFSALPALIESIR